MAKPKPELQNDTHLLFFVPLVGTVFVLCVRFRFTPTVFSEKEMSRLVLRNLVSAEKETFIVMTEQSEQI